MSIVRVFHVRLWCDVVRSNQSPMHRNRIVSVGWRWYR